MYFGRMVAICPRIVAGVTSGIGIIEQGDFFLSTL